MAECALIIEHEPEDALLLRVLLEREGLQVEAVRDLATAVRVAGRVTPDILVLDAPPARAVASCRRIRADERLGRLPLVAIASGAEADASLLEAGADVFVRKPVVPRRLEHELRVALAARAEAAGEAAALGRSGDWVRHLVHDLNNPLTVIGGSLSLLRFDPLTERQTSALSHALSAQDRLSRMVRALLDVQRVGEGGALSVERGPMLVSDLFGEVAAAVAPAAAMRRCDVETHAPPGLRVLCDHDLVLRALVNLGENAVRHTPRRTTVRFEAERTERGVRLGVTDQGQGVPPDARARIFEPFAQIDGGRSGGAAGLGLAWCRLVAEAHGGRAWVQDAVGGGAAFYLTLCE